MTAWSSDELAKIGRSEELQLASVRPDGSLRKPVTVWVARHGDQLYLRSAVKGRNAAWFRGTQESQRDRISAAGIDKDVNLANADRNIDDDVDAAYRAKYRRYAGRILDSALTNEARSTTIELIPSATRP
jgi:hypothetical protein